MTAQSLEATIDLLDRTRYGDQAAWDALVTRHLPLLRPVARRLPRSARSMTDTEDVVQDAFTRAIRHLHQGDFGRRGALLAYLRRAVVNRILDEVRRTARAPVVIPLADYPAPVDSPLDRVIGKEAAARCRSALTHMGTRDRRLILMRLDGRLTYQEIATRMGMRSSDAARVAATRAFWRLGRLVANR